jgi:cysteinyl-tRNA synthetase
MISLYNTLTRKKEEFVPRDKNRVTLYACGPTVYNYIHVGNARMIAVFDTLFRLLRYTYGADHVVYARNITDVDDKIIDAAKREGVAIEIITKKYTEALHNDVAGINALSPTHEPLATDYIADMRTMIEKLIANGNAYVADGHVLFHVPSYPAYGALSRRNRDEQIAGARVEVAPYKRDPADFVLWKPSSTDQPGWESPKGVVGVGRPGWHIECSAMATKLLGVEFDIHGGGLDLTFPHHENEIAQSCCAHPGTGFAKIWMHNGFLNIDNEKMSKSLGNFHLLHDVLKKFRGEDVRYVLLSAQYRQPLEFNFDLLEDAKKTLDRWYRAVDMAPHVIATKPSEAFLQAIQDDLNTPLAFAEIHRLVDIVFNPTSSKDDVDKSIGQILACGNLLGLLQGKAVDRFQEIDNSIEHDLRRLFDLHDQDVGPEELIDRLITARREAKKQKNWAEADRIRAELSAMGIILDDKPDGTTDWRRA